MEAVFANIKKIMKKYENKFEVLGDSKDGYSLSGPYSENTRKKFGSAESA